MKKFPLVLVLLAVMSCDTNTAKQLTADTIATGLSTAIIELGTCEATDLIRIDVKDHVNSWFAIKAQGQQGIGGALCATAIKEIVPSLFGAAADIFKPEYRCKMTSLKNVASTLSTAICAGL